MRLRSILFAIACIWSGYVFAGGGPLGIDRRLAYDDGGIWKRGNQTALVGLMVAGEIAGGL